MLCFFGFFRAGEITTSNISNFDSSKHLAWGDVAIDDGSSPRLLKVHLKQSKTDQLGKGIDIYIGKTDYPLCPVVAIMAYMASRGPSPGPFFKPANNRPLTKSCFTNKIRAGLQAVELPESDFAGHSFRIGAATAAANPRVEDSTIQMLGRWSSAAFLSYIRTPREHLARFSRALAAASPQQQP